MMIGKKKKISKLKTPLLLPKYIQDEFRMTCAIRGYSQIKCGCGKTMSTKYAEMGEFYHGKLPTHPSQIDLLSKAAAPY